MHLMELDAGEICEPCERSIFSRYDIIDCSFLAAGPEYNMLYPLRCPLGSVLLEESFTINAVGISHQGKRTPFQMREDGRCNLEIILYQLGFQDSVGRVQDLIEVRQ